MELALIISAGLVVIAIPIIAIPVIAIPVIAIPVIAIPIIAIPVIAIPIAIWITSLQAKEIDICFNLKSSQDKLLVGSLKIGDISDELLLRLRLPKFTHVGVGGIGPAYNPSFTLWCMVSEELKRRRTSS